MKIDSIIVLPEQINPNQAKVLFDEFKYAWDKTSNDDKKKWANDSVKSFGKVTYRRGKGLVKALLSLTKHIFSETSNLGVAIYNRETKSYFIDRKNKTVQFVSNGAKSSMKFATNLYKLLKTNPKDIGPLIFFGVLGFFMGAGMQVGEKTLYDIDGGIPDLDWKVGQFTDIDLLKHRSPFFHSIISAAVLETMVFSSVNAIHIIHSKLPEKHDVFWDRVVSKTNWAEAFVTGACAGIAYHLLLDGTLDGGGHLSGVSSTLDISMPQEAHQLFFVTNAATETLDLDKKKTEVLYTRPSSSFSFN